jgi:hypothetical protein
MASPAASAASAGLSELTKLVTAAKRNRLTRAKHPCERGIDYLSE